jgi:predicted PurR-regulated permease PerM
MWPGSSPTSVVNGAAGMIIAALVVAALYFGRDLLMPLAFAGLLGFVLAPLVRRLELWGIPNAISVAVVMTLLVVGLLAAGTVAGRQVTQLLEELPTHEANLRVKARYVHSLVGGGGIWQRAADTLRTLEEEVRDPQTDKPIKIEVAHGSNDTLSSVLEYTRQSVPSLLTAALVLLLTIFVLLQYRDLRDRAVRLMGTEEMGRSVQAFDDAGSDLAHYLLLQSGVNLSFGVFVSTCLWAIGVPSPLLWGAVTAALRFVPYVGVLISAALPMALAAMIDPGWWKLVLTASVFIVGDPLLGQIVEPLLFGHQTRLSPLAILIGISFWTLLWGGIGLVLAVPLTLAIVVLGQHLPRLEFLRVLLGNEPALEPHEHLYHQFLASEANVAAKEADSWITDHSFGSYLDEVAVPALRAASDDQKRGVLNREQVAELNVTLQEFIELIKESLEYKHEHLSATDTHDSRSARSEVSALVLAGRGTLDATAAQLIAEVIRLDLGLVVRCPSLGGLTGIGAAAEAEPRERPDIVAFVSVGAVTSAQLRLLLHRLRLAFPTSQIIVGYWDGDDAQDVAEEGRIRYAESATSLLDLVTRTADEIFHKENGKPSNGGVTRRLEVVAP